ncbi:MAG: hypothetical protein HOJ25_04325 [Candidatus Magasanikbacteria bacterium]|nr:hypothetical protein [Candidatus Magasanikbacteria bacterium]
MNQKEACAEVKTMLEEMQKISPKLKDLVDSEGNLEEIKKTKEVLQDILHKHRVLRRNLKEWERRSKKIQRIDKIAEKLKKEGDDADLSVDELHALYKQEMRGFDSSSPFAFSYYAHSETRGLREKRQIEGKTKEDYARIYGCKPEQVTSEEDDVFEKNSNIVVFIGDIDFTKKELSKTLKHVSGNLQSDSKNAKLPKNLEYVGGHFTLKELQEIPKEGLDLQHVTMGGVLNLSSLESAEGLKLPKKTQSLYLSSLESVKGLVLPETLAGDLHLESLKEIPAEGLKLPKKTQSLYLSSLESVKGLVLPETLAGDLSLISLTSAKGLVLPEAIGGRLKLRSLTSAEGLVLPKTVGGDLYLRSLESAKGLVLPETLGGDLWLTSLTSAEGLESLDYTGVRGIVWPPKAFSDKDKEKVEEIKVEQEKKGINVTFF